MSTTPEEIQDKKETLNFIEQIVKDDLAAGRNGGRPPPPSVGLLPFAPTG